MKTPKIAFFATVIALNTLLSANAVSDVFYKWVDENGTTHYGSKPSKEHQSDKVRTQGRSSGPVSKMAPKAQASETESASTNSEGTIAYDAEELAKYCTSMKDRLSLMTSSNQIKQRNKDGSVVMLKEEERQAQISEIKQKIADTCN
ncbi:DUF4124 domain-containing protein [Litoribacillus peritrichatus]|uniref:DUF4124 domain-containing protein n=1 Tax=Litoribacillus peritrichatus TaxID=718191 RepID=A0ABP7NBB3_9GAMM